MVHDGLLLGPFKLFETLCLAGGGPLGRNNVMIHVGALRKSFLVI